MTNTNQGHMTVHSAVANGHAIPHVQGKSPQSIHVPSGHPAQAPSLFDGIGKSVTAYNNRRGISDGTAEDALGVSVKAAVDALDRMDGKADGVIQRSTLVKGYKQVEQMKAQMEQTITQQSPASTQAGNFSQTDIGMLQAGIAIAKLPEHFRITDQAQDAAVRKAVAAIDVNRDGRISVAEQHSVQVPNIINQLVKDLTPHR